jgi:hypothetical protein
MQRPVKDYSQKLLPDRNPQGFGVVTDPVDTDINLAFDAQGIRLIAQLKGDDIGIIVVLQEILVDPKEIFVGAKDILEGSKGPPFLLEHTL